MSIANMRILLTLIVIIGTLCSCVHNEDLFPYVAPELYRVEQERKIKEEKLLMELNIEKKRLYFMNKMYDHGKWMDRGKLRREAALNPGGDVDQFLKIKDGLTGKCSQITDQYMAEFHRWKIDWISKNGGILALNEWTKEALAKTEGDIISIAAIATAECRDEHEPHFNRSTKEIIIDGLFDKHR